MRIYIVYDNELFHYIVGIYSTKEKALAKLKEIYPEQEVIQENQCSTWEEYCECMWGEQMTYDQWIEWMFDEECGEYDLDEDC